MQYSDIIEGIFVERPNRFIAHVLVEGREEIAHVKNTGRCKELLIPGVRVYLEKASNPNRKTKYSLISVYKGDRLVNIDSQVPNQVVYEALKDNKVEGLQMLETIKKEVKYKNSRFDLFFERAGRKGFIEVKGVTLEEEGITLFPDAPTDRGAKHIYELIEAKKEGLEAYVFFLIQMEGIRSFRPNENRDIKFCEAIRKAKESNVNILGYNSIVTPRGIVLNERVQIML